MPKIDFGGDYRLSLCGINAYVTQTGMHQMLSDLDEYIDASEWSISDAEMMERIAKKIREYYKQPMIEE